MKPPNLFNFAIAVLVALSLLAAACGASENTSSTNADCAPAETDEASPATTADSAETDAGQAATPIIENDLKLGYILPATGTLSHLGPTMIKALEMAIDEVRAAGFQTIELFRGDSATSPDVANNLADRHISNDVQAIIGAAASGISLSIIDKVTKAGVAMIAPSNTSPTFTTYDDNGGYYFRTSTSSILLADVLADLVLADGRTSVAIMYRADDYGREIAKATRVRLEESGAKVAAFVELDPEGTTFQSEVLEISSSGADSVILITFTEGAKLLAQMIEANLGPDDLSIYLPEGLADENLWELVDPNDPSVLTGIKAVRVAASPDAETTFPARFDEYSCGLSFTFAPNTYDAVMITMLAALVANSNDPADFIGEIVGVTRDGTKCTRYAECAQLVRDGENIDYDGATGTLEFSDIGEPSQGSYNTLVYNEQGQFEMLDFTTLNLPEPSRDESPTATS